jgi:GT2 family glycosyltransferase
MDLSVVVVNWNSGDHLARLLTSLAPLATELHQILVVDNNSRDQSWKAAESDQAAELLRLERNSGFAAAANNAIERAQSRFILLLNPDIEIIPDSVRNLYNRIVEEESSAIVCGPLIGHNGQAQQQFQLRPLPTGWTVFKDVLFLDELFGLFGSRSSSGFESSPREVEQPAAAFWLLRKAAWTELAGFDENFYPAWFEDVDFCKRLSQTRWRIIFYSDCMVRHAGGASLAHLGRRDFYRVFYTNLLRYLRKHHVFSYPLLWFPVKFGMAVRSWRASN